MLEIQEKFSAEGYGELIEKAEGYDLHITEAFDKGRVTGFIAYAYSSGKTLIFDYDDGGDLYLCDGLVRSVLFKSCLKGIEEAYFVIEDGEKLDRLKKLKFVQNDDKTLKNLDDFMNSCKKCREKSQ